MQVYNLKQHASPEALCESQPSLLPFVKEVFSLAPDEEPFYGKLRHMLVAGLLQKEVAPQKDLV